MKSFLATPLLALPLFLAGCGANLTTPTASSLAVPGAAFQGKVFGGEQPLQNAKIYFYSAGNSTDNIMGYTPGYGSAANSLLSANGHNYVTTSATGTFSISNDYNCPQQNSQVYLISVGGNPGIGAGTDNQAAVLMAALGTCGNLSSSTFVTINELTTVAAVTALQQFIDPSGDPTLIGASSTNVQGMNNAFLTAQQLVPLANGYPQTDTSLVKFPSDKIITLGNAMVGCVNGTGASSGTCPNYFAAARIPGASTSPTTTFQAMLNIARYPASNPTGVINSTQLYQAFGPSLVSAHDLSLAVTYTGGNIATATGIAIDQTGNAFVTTCGHSCDNQSPYDDAVVEIQPYGTTGTLANGYIASGTGFADGSVIAPQALAINESNYIGVNNGNSTFTSLYPGGQVTPSSPLSNAAINTPLGIAFDNTGVAFLANAGNGTAGSNKIVSVDLSGSVGTPFTNASLHVPTGIAFAFNQPVNNLIVTDQGIPGSTSGGIVIFHSSGSSYDTGSYTMGGASNGGALHPGGVALDASQNIWEVDSTVSDSSAKVFKLSPTAGPAFPASSGVAITGSGTIEGLAIDGDGNVILPSCTAPGCGGDATDNIYFLNNAGAAITGRTGLQDSHLNNPVSIAIDSSGNLWLANAGHTNNGSATRFIGIAAPVQTPIASAVANQTTGSRP